MFFLDDIQYSPFLWDPSPDSSEQYLSAPVYTNTSVGSAADFPSGLHNLTVVSGAAVLFDYAMYTYVAANVHLVIRVIHKLK